jgi:hypothetical protein
MKLETTVKRIATKKDAGPINAPYVDHETTNQRTTATAAIEAINPLRENRIRRRAFTV